MKCDRISASDASTNVSVQTSCYIAIPTSDIRSSEWPDLCSELLGFITLIVAFWLPYSLRAGLPSSYSA
jgi:hypothetical protein